MKEFNVTGNCVPDMHYMVDTSNKITQIMELVKKRKYFTINRARQYGKTTTLGLLKKALMSNYMCIHMSFENAGKVMFDSVEGFCQMFLWHVEKVIKPFYPEQTGLWQDETIKDFNMLGEHISELCKEKKVVLLIDEVDRASNYTVFLMFLAMLRDKYIDRNNGVGDTFQSVILAGVVDIKNIKIVMEQKGLLVRKEGEVLSASPWNIAADFKIDMSFSPADIATMLQSYENDYHTGMDIMAIAGEIYNYTSGYPFMVSRLCQHIHEELNRDWTIFGVQAAVKIIIKEDNTLFDDMYKNMENNKNLYNLLHDVLIAGKPRTFARGSLPVKLGLMYGIIKESENGVAISNKIFESVICNKFIADDEIENPDKQITDVLKEDVVVDGRFNMALCIEKFAKHYYTSFANRDLEFYERHGRLLFLAYLQPLINGTGFYHIESETRNTRRMDIVVDYGTDQFIIELKLWSGDTAHDKAYTQLLSYMDSRGAAEGYLLTFDFRQDVNKERKAEWVELDGKFIFDVVV